MFNVLTRVVNLTPGWKLARPANSANNLETCTRNGPGEVGWADMVEHNGGRIDVFADHACYHRRYMNDPVFWSLKKEPVTLALMRRPEDQFASKFRYTLYCCERSAAAVTSAESKRWRWCKLLCLPKATESPAAASAAGSTRTTTTTTTTAVSSLAWYMNRACVSDQCNIHRRYMGRDEPTEADIVDSYFLVLILERFDESLALLALKLGLPLRALPHLPENTNSVVARTNFTELEQSRIELRTRRDTLLYKEAVSRLDAKLAALTRAERERFNWILQGLRTANVALAATCEPACASKPALTLEKRTCLEECVEQQTSDEGLWQGGRMDWASSISGGMEEMAGEEEVETETMPPRTAFEEPDSLWGGVDDEAEEKERLWSVVVDDHP